MVAHARTQASRSYARLSLAACVVLSIACGSSQSRGVAGDPIRVDGSSTVYPVTQAVAEEFKKANPAARPEVAFSGTTAGFERFCRGELDIQDASRPIRASESSQCEAKSVKFLEIPVAHDGVTVVVNSKNDWATTMTVTELKALWQPTAEGKVKQWSDVRSDWPQRPITLVGPGPQSGTFDFFTQAVVGTEDSSRKDYTSSEDDDVIVKTVSSDELALGYVGYGYFEKHRATLKAVAIDDLDNSVGVGPIAPSPDSVRRGLYRPLSRPLFIYVNLAAMERPEIKAFVDFYLRQDERIVQEVGCIAMNAREYDLVRQRVAKRATGTLFSEGTRAANLELLLSEAQ